jgi:hypothetical protein
MASRKVILRTAFNDAFVAGDTVITKQGTELPSRAKADEVMGLAKQSGVTLYEVPADEAATKPNEGSGS